MNLNRRTFIQAAALLPAVASQTRGMVSASHSPVLSHPLEVDLAEPGAARHIGNSATEVYVRLEELYPGDPGQLSGASLRIMDSGKFTALNAECSSLQRDGSQLAHAYGCLSAEDLVCVGAADPTDAGAGFFLRFLETFPRIRPERYSGASLILVAGGEPELRVCFGNHCLGVLRGQLLTTFLACVRQRCEMGAA